MTHLHRNVLDLEKHFLQNQEKYRVNYSPFETSWLEQHGDSAGCGTLFECLEWSLHRVSRACACITDVMAECLEHGHSSGGDEEASSDWYITFEDYSEDPNEGGEA